MNPDLFWIAIAAFAVWFVFIRSSSRGATRAQEVGASETPPTGETEDTELAQILAAMSAHKEEEDKWWSESEARRKESEPFRSKVWKAAKIIEDTGLGEALPRLWKRLTDSHAFGEDKAEDLARFADLRIEQGPEGPSAISWRWGGALYRLECEDPFRHPTLRLAVDDEPVIGINCSISSNWPLSYEYLSLERLKVGPWMEEIARMGGILRRAEAQAWDTMYNDADRETAALIDLGDEGRKNQTATD